MAPAATDEVTEAVSAALPVHGPKPTKSTISASVLHGPRDLRLVSSDLPHVLCTSHAHSWGKPSCSSGSGVIFTPCSFFGVPAWDTSWLAPMERGRYPSCEETTPGWDIMAFAREKENLSHDVLGSVILTYNRRRGQSRILALVSSRLPYGQPGSAAQMWRTTRSSPTAISAHVSRCRWATSPPAL